MNDIEDTNGSWHNRSRLTPGTACGCFYCEAVFAADEIQQWVDDDLTALCPRCGIDSVLAGMTDARTLHDLHESRFSEAPVPSDAEWNDASPAPRRSSGG